MKDTNKPTREAYIAALAPVVGGVPIYDQQAPLDAPELYILLMDILNGDLPVKCGFRNDVALTLKVVKKFNLPARINADEADDLAGVIMERIRGQKALNMMPNFSINALRKDRDANISYNDKTHNIYERILTFRAKVMQINN